MPSEGLNVALYQSDSGLHADRLFESSQQPHAVGSIISILQTRRGLESLIRLSRVRTWNQTWVCLISALAS